MSCHSWIRHKSRLAKLSEQLQHDSSDWNLRGRKSATGVAVRSTHVHRGSNHICAFCVRAEPNMLSKSKGGGNELAVRMDVPSLRAMHERHPELSSHAWGHVIASALKLVSWFGKSTPVHCTAGLPLIYSNLSRWDTLSYAIFLMIITKTRIIFFCF